MAFDFSVPFDEAVRAQRRRQGMTQEELASRTGLSVRSIRGIETNRVRAPRVATVRLLADAFGLQGTDRERFLSSAAASEPSAVSPAPTGPLPRPAALPVPAQLPANVPGFTGRRAHLAQLDALLADGREPAAALISAIGGTAGVGKTALAVHWAHRVADRFPDGQLYVNLRGFDPGGTTVSPAEAVRGFLDALGVPPHRVPVGLQAQVGLYRSLLAGRRMLVVLDNARDAEQVRPLLPGSAVCQAVVTSRNQMPGLVAADGAQPLLLDLLTVEEASQVLLRRLGPDRVAAEPAAVEEIIDRCARLPLALAIVAARAATRPATPLATLAWQLRQARSGLDPFTDSTDATTDVRAVFSWSYHALSVPAARLFRLLGLHPGPDITLRAAAGLAGMPAGQIRPLLTQLTRTHLLTESAAGRYTFHDLLRAYATELVNTTEGAQTRHTAARRVLDHYLHTAHHADRLLYHHRKAIVLDPPHSGSSPERLDGPDCAVAWFTAERDVLAATVRHAAATGFDTHTWQLGWALEAFLDRRGHWHDWAAIARTAVAAADRLADPAAQAHAHRGLANAYARLRRFDDAHAHLDLALRYYARLTDPAGHAHAHMNLAWVYGRQDRHHEALEHSQQALALYRTAGYQPGQANALNAVGWHHAQLGDYHQTLTYCRQSLALHQQLGDGLDAGVLDSLGYAHLHLGQHQQAIAHYRQALARQRDLGDRYYEAEALAHLGDAYHAAGDLSAARTVWQHALDLFTELGHADADQVRGRLHHLDQQPVTTPAINGGR